MGDLYGILDDKGLVPINENFSNPNLLINSDFRNPINQRGATSYSSVDGSYTCVYSISRWRLQLGCCLAVNDGSITLTSSITSGTCGFQYVPENVYYEDDYTIQVNVKSLSGDANLTVYASGAKVMLQEILSVGDNVFNIKNSDIMLIQINITTSTTIELEYIKLERGSIATPLVPRPYAEELALCQRYYEEGMLIINPINGSVNTVYYTVVNGGSFMTEKRAKPTITVTKITDSGDNELSYGISQVLRSTKNINNVIFSNAQNGWCYKIYYIADAEIY